MSRGLKHWLTPRGAKYVWHCVSVGGAGKVVEEVRGTSPTIRGRPGPIAMPAVVAAPARTAGEVDVPGVPADTAPEAVHAPAPTRSTAPAAAHTGRSQLPFIRWSRRMLTPITRPFGCRQASERV